MTLQQRGQYRYGDSPADIRHELTGYSESKGYPAQHFADALCPCGSRAFGLSLDDNEGAAVRRCIACATDHAIGDSAESIADATLEECACPCGGEAFEITVGVALYDGSDDMRWLYIGCRCIGCGLVAVYGDWKNEFIGYQALLAAV